MRFPDNPTLSHQIGEIFSAHISEAHELLFSVESSPIGLTRLCAEISYKNYQASMNP